jgi:hypothetical protein
VEKLYSKGFKKQIQPKADSRKVGIRLDFQDAN